VFYPNKCEFQDLGLGRMIGSARMQDGLYYFEDNLSSNNSILVLGCNVSSLPVGTQIMMWHFRLGHSCMLSMEVPKYLWWEVVLNAAYLINKVPTQVLNHDTLMNYFRKWFPTNRLSANLPLKVFSCIVFSRSKLDARAEKCVFVGYAPHQKGYKCFNPSNRKVFVSMNVVFCENKLFLEKHLHRETQREDVGIFWDNFVVLPNI